MGNARYSAACMSNVFACVTVFLLADREALVSRYESLAEPANGYLTRVGETYLMTDAAASEGSDWARQVRLALEMSEELTALTIVIYEEYWALTLAHDEQQGPAAIYLPVAPEMLRNLPRQLFDVEKALVDLLPFDADADRIDALFGAVLEEALPIEDALTELLGMFGCPAEWIRWSWYETIPQQLFTDPDLAGRVTPLGEARQFWEE